MRAEDDTNDIIAKLLKSFLENYETEENVIRNGSNYVFGCVHFILMQFHSKKIKKRKVIH